MENILIGTTSESKFKIVKDFFNQQGKEYNIIPQEVGSEITDQPLDEDTTILGATNRAKNTIKNHGGDFAFSIGLEGGLIKINGLNYLICIVVMINKQNRQFIGTSSELPLPKKVSEQIDNSEQFGDAIRVFRKENVNNSQVFIDHLDELIERKKSFTEALRIAFLLYSFQDHFYNKKTADN